MKVREVVEGMPDASAMEGLQAVAEQDPVVWGMLYRRVKGQALTYDNAKKLSEESLGTIKKTLIKSDYEDELYDRLLHHRPYLTQPARDQHKHQSHQKARQVGVSELGVTKVMHFLATHPGTKWVTTFPRDRQLIDFSNTRVANTFAESPYMNDLVGTPNQVMAKAVGKSHWLFRSAWESNLGEGIDADGVTLDEMDRMRDKIEFAFKESLKSSKHHYMMKISTPTLPNSGINVSFSNSDQMTWLVKCSKCGLEQEITHTENIVPVKHIQLGTKELPPESYDYLCRKQKCRGKLDRVFTGRWVPKYSDRRLIRGYHMSQLIACWISATQVMQDKIDMRFLEIWMNYVLGLPASGALEMISDQDCQMACAGHQLFEQRTGDYTHVTAGIDWGQYNWVTVFGRNGINNRTYVIGLAVFEDVPGVPLGSAIAVGNYLEHFGPDLIIADAGYGKDRNSYIKKRFSPNDEGRFYAQYYNPSEKTSRTFQPEWSDPARARVLVDRTLHLKNLCHAVKAREFGLPDVTLEIVQLLIKHLKSLAPYNEVDDHTKQVVESVRSSGEDHFAHASASGLLAMERLAKLSRFSASFV